MTELIWPPSLRVSSAEWSLIGNAGESRSPLNGVGQTIDRSGDRWKVTLNVENASDRATVAERSIAEAFLAAIRNKNNRVWVTPPGYVQRGSFPSGELFTNADFANGTTGWTQTNVAMTVRDRVARMAVTAVAANPQIYQSAVSVTQYAPHIQRSLINAGSGLTGISAGPAISDAAGQAATYLTSRGLLSAVRVIAAASCNAFPLVVSPVSGYEVGHYLELPFTSFSRCALVDSGVNALLYSDQLDNAAWTKGGSAITANAATAPDGTSTADAIVENGLTDYHYVAQTAARASVAEDGCAFGYFKRGSGTRDVRVAVLAGGVDYAACIFDLGAGSAGTVNLNGSVTNGRAYIRDAGNGWYYCAVVARLPASTTIGCEADLIASGAPVYPGNGTSSIYAWHLGTARSSLPTRGAQTTSTALASGTSQTGSGVYLKGLPASTQNLARAGDWCQIGDQLFKVTSPLDGDAAGLGYLTVSPNVRTPFADNAPVIFNQPMAKMRLATEEMSWSLHPGGFGTFQLTFEESL